MKARAFAVRRLVVVAAVWGAVCGGAPRTSSGDAQAPTTLEEELAFLRSTRDKVIRHAGRSMALKAAAFRSRVVALSKDLRGSTPASPTPEALAAAEEAFLEAAREYGVVVNCVLALGDEAAADVEEPVTSALSRLQLTAAIPPELLPGSPFVRTTQEHVLRVERAALRRATSAARGLLRPLTARGFIAQFAATRPERPALLPGAPASATPRAPTRLRITACSSGGPASNGGPSPAKGRVVAAGRTEAGAAEVALRLADASGSVVKSFTAALASGDEPTNSWTALYPAAGTAGDLGHGVPFVLSASHRAGEAADVLVFSIPSAAVVR